MWSLFTFGQWPCFFLHTLAAPQLVSTTFFLRTLMQWPVRGRSTFVMGCCPPHHLDLQWAFLCIRSQRGFLDLGSDPLIATLAENQPLPLALSLEYLGKTKLQFYSTWQTPAVQGRGPSQAHQFMYMTCSYPYLSRQSGWTILCWKIWFYYIIRKWKM